MTRRKSFSLQTMIWERSNAPGQIIEALEDQGHIYRKWSTTRGVFRVFVVRKSIALTSGFAKSCHIIRITSKLGDVILDLMKMGSRQSTTKNSRQ
jgi:hypothetical protein